MLYRTCHAPEHAISQDRMATGEWILPAETIAQRKASYCNAEYPSHPCTHHHHLCCPTTATPTLHLAQPLTAHQKGRRATCWEVEA